MNGAWLPQTETFEIEFRPLHSLLNIIIYPQNNVYKYDKYNVYNTFCVFDAVNYTYTFKAFTWSENSSHVDPIIVTLSKSNNSNFLQAGHLESE